MIKPIAKRSVYKEVFDYIIKMITDGEISLGEKLPNEMELAESFQVSRNSVREALKSLEIMDIITSKAGTGTIVSPTALRNIKYLNLFTTLDQKNVTYDLLESRLIIEPELTFLSIVKSTKSDIANLEKIIQDSVDSLNNKTYRWNLGQPFHDEIARISRNKYLEQFLSATADEISAVRSRHILSLDQNELLSELEEHKEILDCFKKKDAERGRKIMRDHLNSAIELLYEFIKEDDE
ncbi:MAG: FadR family transcriptional regulator [Clostridia bacterium]|nr:FadR family transcriptional regulator [Clostridia bacterium]